LDGSKRAKYAAALQIHKQLGWITPNVAESLSEKFLKIGSYTRLVVVGGMALL
ncbi:MAG: asparaginase, partial [Dolichospermum sp.]